MSEKIEAWVTNGSFVAGIRKVSGEVRGDILTFVGSLGRSSAIHEGRDWHCSEQSAMARMEQLRRAKIADLEEGIRWLAAAEIRTQDLTKEA